MYNTSEFNSLLLNICMKLLGEIINWQRMRYHLWPGLYKYAIKVLSQYLGLVKIWTMKNEVHLNSSKIESLWNLGLPEIEDIPSIIKYISAPLNSLYMIWAPGLDWVSGLRGSVYSP